MARDALLRSEALLSRVLVHAVVSSFTFGRKSSLPSNNEQMFQPVETRIGYEYSEALEGI